MLNKTIVVKTGNGYHVYFRNTGRMLKSVDFTKNGITIEIKGQGKYVIGASSRHYDKDAEDNQYLSGKVYEIISNVTTIVEIDGEEFIQKLQEKGWKPIGSVKPVSELYEELSAKGEGSNRQGDLIRILSSLKIKNPEMDFEDLTYHGSKINSKFKTPYPQNTVNQKITVSWNWATDILENRTKTKLEENELFSKIWNTKPEIDKVRPNSASIITLCIKIGHIVVKSELRKKLFEWCKKHDVNPTTESLEKSVKIVVDRIFADNTKFADIKKISYELGILQKPIIFDKTQTIEVGEWVKGRLGVKRIELNGIMIYFNGMYHEKYADESIERAANAALSTHTNASIKEIIGYIKRTCQLINNSDIAKSVHLKCLLNGIYNIKTGKFSTSFNPNDIILNQIPHNYNESTFPTITKRIKQILQSNFDRQSYLDFSSICLHPYTGIDFQYGVVGIAGTGKTQLGTLLDVTFGEKNVSHSSIHDIAHDHTIQQDIAYNFLNYDEELSDQDIKNINILKKWITQSNFTGRAIYERKAEFRPTARQMFMTNSIFEIPNSDDALAIYERTYLAKAVNHFRGETKEIKNLWADISEKEFEGFITYLLHNATEIFKNQRIQYPQNVQSTEKLWNEYGNNIHKFIDEWIEKGKEFKNEAREIWNKWLEHALENKIDIKSKNHFYKTFDKIIGSGSIKIRDGTNEYYGYVGLRLKTENDLKKEREYVKTLKGGVENIMKDMGIHDIRFVGVVELLKNPINN